MLADLLQEEYALALSPGFFRFYALMGVVQALDENRCLRITACAGSSAGALVSGFLASGMSTAEMPPRVFSIKREDIWDVGLGVGLLKGQLFQRLLEAQLPTGASFETCRVPLGVTAYDVVGFRTLCVQAGSGVPLATAIRASCTFPGLFQPVMIHGRPHIDGGIHDDSGMMALPCVPPSNLIVNVVCGRGRIASSRLPERFRHCRLLTLCLDNVPMVSPLTMETAGPHAYAVAKAATYRLLRAAHLQQLAHNHWLAFIDGAGADLSLPLVPLPRRREGAASGVRSTRSYEFLEAATATGGGSGSSSSGSNRKRKAAAAADTADAGQTAEEKEESVQKRRGSDPRGSAKKSPTPSSKSSSSRGSGGDKRRVSGQRGTKN